MNNTFDVHGQSTSGEGVKVFYIWYVDVRSRIISGRAGKL